MAGISFAQPDTVVLKTHRMSCDHSEAFRAVFEGRIFESYAEFDKCLQDFMKV